MEQKKVLATFNLTCYDDSYAFNGTGESKALMLSLIRLALEDAIMKEVLLGAAWAIVQSENNKQHEA